MNETQSESLPKPVENTQPSGIARRRLLRAGLAAGPVVLALSGRSAMANTGASCAKGLSPLAWNSLAPDGTNCKLTSHTVSASQLGVSPGNWKPNGNGMLTYPWPNLCLPYTSYPANPPGSLSDSAWATGTKYSAIFAGVNVYSESVSGIRSMSVSRIFIDHPGTVESHLCAAFLNAATGNGNVMTAQEVQSACAGIVGNLSLTRSQMKDYLDQTWS